jgi:hypothetical protein
VTQVWPRTRAPPTRRRKTPEPRPAAAVASSTDDAPGGAGLAETARGLWRDDRVEIVATVLLSAAVLLSAWGAYQATRWSGEQSNNYATSAALRAEAGRHGTTASRQVQVDVLAFVAWSQAKAQQDSTLADFLRARFRAEFVPAFDSWLATAAPDAAGLPSGTPFDLPSYQLAEQQQADELVAQADAALAEAQRDNQIADDFVLTAVLFASVLFFAGTAAKFRPQSIRWSLLAVASLVFVIGLIVEFSLPQNVGF